MRIASPRLALALLAAALPLAAVLAACSSNDTKKTTADKWVADTCAVAVTFNKATDAASIRLDSADPDKDPKGAKAAFLAAFGDVEKARTTFRSDFDKLGEPDLKSGADVRKAFQAHDDASKQTLADVRKKIGDLDAGSKSFGTDVVKIVSDVPNPSFRADLQKVADKQSDAKQVIDLIDKNTDCARVLFNSSDGAKDASTPTPEAKASSTAKPASSPTAQATSTTSGPGSPKAHTTPKPNASTNEKWVVGLCVSTQTWLDDITTLSDGVDVSKAGGDTQKLKQIIVDFLNNATSRSQQFKRDVDKLGNPDVKDGAKIEQAMSQASGQVVTIFQKATTDANALDGNNAQKLADGLTALGGNLDAASSDVSDAFSQIDTDYDTSSLTTIAQQVPECAGLFN